jgi:hypothetical protein
MGRTASRNHFAGTCLSERASLVLWEEGDWRCEFNPGLAGVGRLEVYQADQLILAEEALSGPSAAHAKLKNSRTGRFGVSAVAKDALLGDRPGSPISGSMMVE